MQNCLVFAHTLVDSHTPYTIAKSKVYSFMPFSQNCNVGHGLGKRKGQTNGMLILPIFSIHKMADQTQTDVISKVKNF